MRSMKFTYKGEAGVVQFTLLGGTEHVFVGWSTIGANLESLRPEAGLADKIDKCLQVLGACVRCNREPRSWSF